MGPSRPRPVVFDAGAFIAFEKNEVQPLDLEEAMATGILCGDRNVNDVVDASVVLLARRCGACIVTSDPDDLRRIDPNVVLVPC
ncbi:MAG: hypothetical protein IPG17_29640 [Sandaracinaceae bacterium]|jgi:hypothetical protein|nr:hypothetical protein [Sandaracinaceae bacterium]MBK6812208.1 hypothetical protein [Sandaracinaceae bacterium]MBK7777413.1 hypothetical protein [Sandaracinaceae bacterium]MBK8409729.1 hypothetical protein [Sandaracinaceae bacterium]